MKPRKRRARDLLTDPALRARVAASVTGIAPTPLAAPAPIQVVEIVDYRVPYWRSQWFAVTFTALGMLAGSYLFGG